MGGRPGGLRLFGFGWGLRDDFFDGSLNGGVDNLVDRSLDDFLGHGLLGCGGSLGRLALLALQRVALFLDISFPYSSCPINRRRVV